MQNRVFASYLAVRRTLTRGGGGRAARFYGPGCAGGSREALEALAVEVNAAAAEAGQPAKSVDEVAMGFIQVANEAMCRPIRALTQMKVCLSVCRPICALTQMKVCVCLPAHPRAHADEGLSVCLPAHPRAHSDEGLSVRLSVCRPIRALTQMKVCPSVCLSADPSARSRR
jgi:hypothetical protein